MNKTVAGQLPASLQAPGGRKSAPGPPLRHDRTQSLSCLAGMRFCSCRGPGSRETHQGLHAFAQLLVPRLACSSPNPVCALQLPALFTRPLLPAPVCSRAASPTASFGVQRRPLQGPHRGSLQTCPGVYGSLLLL